MITVKCEFRNKRLTADQRALKKAIRPLARDTKNKIKGEAPQLTGALKLSFDFKIKSKQGNAYAIIGVKSRYQRNAKGVLKMPVLYSLKAEAKYGFLKRNGGSKLVNKLKSAIDLKLKEG